MSEDLGPPPEPGSSREPESPPSEPDVPTESTPRGATRVCRRCRKAIGGNEEEPLFLHTGLCSWCAYVDSQA